MTPVSVLLTRYHLTCFPTPNKPSHKARYRSQSPLGRVRRSWNTAPTLLSRLVGIKGLSKGVIKQAWRDGRLDDLAEGTRIDVDVAGWLHRAVVSNARDICLESTQTIIVQALCATFNSCSMLKSRVLVFDGDRASRTADINDNDSDMDPTWNTAAAKVPAFLAALKRHDFLFNRRRRALALHSDTSRTARTQGGHGVAHIEHCKQNRQRDTHSRSIAAYRTRQRTRQRSCREDQAGRTQSMPRRRRRGQENQDDTAKDVGAMQPGAGYKRWTELGLPGGSRGICGACPLV